MSDFTFLAAQMSKLETRIQNLENELEKRDEIISELQKDVKDHGEAILSATNILQRLVNLLYPPVES